MSNKQSELLNNKVFLQQTFQLIKSLDYNIRHHEFSVIHYEIKQLLTILHMLEIEDCGSIGGFSKNSPPTKHLIKRLDFLFRKNNIDTTEIEKQLNRLKQKSINE